jgi:hypothetical protein
MTIFIFFSAIWIFVQTAFGWTAIRSNVLSVKWHSVKRFPSNGVSVKWPFGQIFSVKWFYGWINFESNEAFYSFGWCEAPIYNKTFISTFWVGICMGALILKIQKFWVRHYLFNTKLLNKSAIRFALWWHL